MRSSRITDNDKRGSIKGQYLSKLEDLAMEMYDETGIRMDSIRFIWTESNVPESDIMNDEGESEKELTVNVCESNFR